MPDDCVLFLMLSVMTYISFSVVNGNVVNEDGPRFKDAADMIAKGMGQRWYKYENKFERDMLIESITRVNYERGATGMSALRHYLRDGYLVICEGPNIDAEKHPNDVANEVEELKAKLAALGH